jgi:RNA recognition motif-containing protein
MSLTALVLKLNRKYNPATNISARLFTLSDEGSFSRHPNQIDTSKQYRIYLSNLPYDLTLAQLEDYCLKKAITKPITIEISDKEGKPTGRGYLDFKSSEAATAALKNLNHSNLKWRQINATMLTQNDSNGNSRFWAAARSVFVSRLSYEVTWRQLKDHFKSVGNVVYAKTMNSRDGLPMGCGVVEFSTSKEAEAAIERFDGSAFYGMNIFVRKDREPNRLESNRRAQMSREQSTESSNANSSSSSKGKS